MVNNDAGYEPGMPLTTSRGRSATESVDPLSGLHGVGPVEAAGVTS